MVVTASALRQNIYKLLDQVLETGEPLEIERKGRRLRVVPADAQSKLASLVPHPDAIVGDPEDLVHMDWLSEWRPYLGGPGAWGQSPLSEDDEPRRP